MSFSNFHSAGRNLLNHSTHGVVLAYAIQGEWVLCPVLTRSPKALLVSYILLLLRRAPMYAVSAMLTVQLLKYRTNKAERTSRILTTRLPAVILS